MRTMIPLLICGSGEETSLSDRATELPLDRSSECEGECGFASSVDVRRRRLSFYRMRCNAPRPTLSDKGTMQRRNGIMRESHGVGSDCVSQAIADELGVQ